MKQCEFCGAFLPVEASFCGKCGRVSSRTAHHATQVGELPTMHLEQSVDEHAPTALAPLLLDAPKSTSSGPLHPVTLIPLVEEEEEEKRSHTFVPDLGLPLLGEIIEGQPLNQVPTVQGTPQVAQVPTLPNTTAPAAPGDVLQAPGSPVDQGASVPVRTLHRALHHVVRRPILPPLRPPRLPGRPGNSSGGSDGSPGGCLTVGAIILATFLLILAIFAGLGLTVFAPSLSLSGSSSVITGSNMTLHGSGFLPNSSVTLTLDSGVPLFVFHSPALTRLSYKGARTAASTGPLFSSGSKNVISVNNDGSFTTSFLVDPSWSPGRHIIHAGESVSHRSASLPFTILLAGTTTTATDTPTTAPTSTPTGTPTPTATATIAPTLSCATPGNITLGPVSEGSTQVITNTVTLCTSGSGTLTWKAFWNQNQASWLQVAQTSGTVQAPNLATVAIGASAANLAAGTYTTAITFIGLESNTAQVVNVTLTVKAGCVNAVPQQLAFTGVAGVSNPARPQTVTITNCGLSSRWSASVSSGSNWLALTPAQGTLNGGASTSMTVTASNLRAGLKAGNYAGSILISIGSHKVTVAVTLNVLPQPIISASPNPLNSTCQLDQNGNEDCSVTLSNSSSSVALNWSASTDNQGAQVPSSGSIPAGGQQVVTVVILRGTCTNITITFTGPGANNSAAVTWDCNPNA